MKDEVEKFDLAAAGLLTKWEAAKEARKKIRELEAFADEVEAEVRRAAGTAQMITIYGTPEYSYAYTRGVAWKEWAKANPITASAYTRQVMVEELDKDALCRDHSSSLDEFRIRPFRAITKR